MNTDDRTSVSPPCRLKRLALQLGLGFFLAKGCFWLVVAALAAERL